ncbi:MAG: acetyl-CoA carboxylase biotin carboxyl carrier protein subunit [Bryobacteraceae bacterium]
MKLKITVDGAEYDVDVEVVEDDPPARPVYHAQSVSLPAPAPVASGVHAAPHSREDKVCRSPIVGTVVRINTQPGQQLQVNDPMMVLEAMKMETNITAPVAGRIRAINVNPGENVQMGQVLVEFE